MELGEWVKSNVDYGRRLVGSGIEGARSGQDEFLNGEPLAPFLGESFRGALVPAALGACVGVLVGYPICRKKSPAITWAYGLLGLSLIHISPLNRLIGPERQLMKSFISVS